MNTDSNSKMIEALLNYFVIDAWKPSKGLNKVAPFKKWGERELQYHILALAKVGIIEKKAGTATTSAVYRISHERAEYWKNKFEQILQAASPISELDFRTMYILYVIGIFYLEHQRPPRQSELYFSDAPGHHGGLINDWLRESGALAEDPNGITGPPQIRTSTKKLAELGYMIERGGGAPGNRKPYLLTEKGLELVKQLQSLDWRKWTTFSR